MTNDTAPQQHGGLREAELRALGLRPDLVLDFSASVNPLGASPAAVRAAAAVDLSRYPDPDCTALREAIAAANGVSPDHVLPGSGATELIHLVVRLFARHRQRPIAFMPAFGEFIRACQLTGVAPFPWHANPDRGYQWTLRNKPDVLKRVIPPLVYLCNPNNPTGVYVAEQDVRALAASLTAGPLLLDESYVAFVTGAWNAVPLTRDGRVIVLRSMTKDYGLAGLRLGYLIAQPEIVQAVGQLQPEWSVSAVAQAAGVAALGDRRHVIAGREAADEAKAYLIERLTARGLPVVPSAANFLMVEVGDATAVRGALLRRGIAVRDCTSFGLPRHLRIGMRLLPDCRRLIDELFAVLATMPPPDSGQG